MSTRESSPFGRLLRSYRLAAGLSQERLAEHAGLSLRGISDLERGMRTAPRLETVRLLADGLGLEEPDRAALLAARNVVAAGSQEQASPGPWPKLHVPPTPFIGRQCEVKAVVDLLHREDVRLVTLTGPGGVGKMRLVLEVGQELADCIDEAVLFVDLSSVRNATHVLPTIAAVAGVQDSGARPLVEALAGALDRPNLLLVLDNLEQVVEAAPDLAPLLATCSSLKILTTSRVRLRLAAEHLFPVGPLRLPETATGSSMDELARTEAVAFFVDRSQAADPTFALTESNNETAAMLVSHLDGLPLAIELAAARIALLPPEALLARMKQRLPLLTGGLRDAPARQRTMRDAIAWSYDLLTPDEQRLFRRLAVFVGGFTVEAAEAVVAEGEIETPVIESLSVLVDHSLVRYVSDPSGAGRFRYLESLREYGLERLAASGEEQEARDAHATYFIGAVASLQERVSDAEPIERGARLVAFLDRLEAERDNLRAVLAWLTQQERIEEAIALAVAIWPFRTNLTHDIEARATLESLLALPQARACFVTRAHALNALCHLARRQGDSHEAVEAGEEALALFREADDHMNAGRVLISLGWVLMDIGRHDEALEHYRESLRLAEMVDDWEGVAAAHDLLGWVHMARNEHEASAAHLQEALQVSRAAGDPVRLGNVLGHLGVLARRENDTVRAARYFQESIAIAREIGDQHLLPSALAVYSDILRRDGDLAAAET